MILSNQWTELNETCHKNNQQTEMSRASPCTDTDTANQCTDWDRANQCTETDRIEQHIVINRTNQTQEMDRPSQSTETNETKQYTEMDKTCQYTEMKRTSQYPQMDRTYQYTVIDRTNQYQEMDSTNQYIMMDRVTTHQYTNVMWSDHPEFPFLSTVSGLVALIRLCLTHAKSSKINIDRTNTLTHNRSKSNTNAQNANIPHLTPKTHSSNTHTTDIQTSNICRPNMSRSTNLQKPITSQRKPHLTNLQNPTISRSKTHMVDIQTPNIYIPNIPACNICKPASDTPSTDMSVADTQSTDTPTTNTRNINSNVNNTAMCTTSNVNTTTTSDVNENTISTTNNVNNNSRTTRITKDHTNLKNGAVINIRKRQLWHDSSATPSPCSPLAVCCVLTLTMLLTPCAAGSMLDMVCSSVCRHGTCSYPMTGANKPTVVCHCEPGWGGEHCSLPCSLPCVGGQCVFVGDKQLCLCPLGLRLHNCSQTDNDLRTLLSVAHMLKRPQTGREPDSRPNPSPSSLSSSSSGSPSHLRADKAADRRPTTSSSSKGKGQTPPASTPRSIPVTPTRKGGSNQTTAPTADSPVTSTPEVTTVAEEAKHELLVALVTNPRDIIEQNVQKGASQCMSNFVCQHGGRCVVGRYGGFRCECKAPFFGTFCQHTCPRPCLNGARCVRVRPRDQRLTHTWTAAIFVFRCVCPPGFSGQQCQNYTAL